MLNMKQVCAKLFSIEGAMQWGAILWYLVSKQLPNRRLRLTAKSAFLLFQKKVSESSVSYKEHPALCQKCDFKHFPVISLRTCKKGRNMLLFLSFTRPYVGQQSMETDNMDRQYAAME